MTIDELKERLESLNLPGDTVVVMSRDAEGNDFSPLNAAEFELYEPTSTYSGELVELEDEEETPDGVVPSVVLWPTN